VARLSQLSQNNIKNTYFVTVCQRLEFNNNSFLLFNII
jgi:hypothetical protein